MTAAPDPDPYLVLGVTAEASDDYLDHAFRSLVRRLHPDTRPAAATDTGPDPAAGNEPDTVAAADANADQQLQELLTAYATLRDPIRRAAHDRTRLRPEPNHTPTSRMPFPDSSTIPADPAISAGPVHWQPLPEATGGTGAARRRAR